MAKRLKKWQVVLISIASVVAVAGVGAGLYFGIGAAIDSQTNRKFSFEPYVLGSHGDRIHFLNTPGADAILIESDGHYALVDAAEDSDNPRGFAHLKYDGYETLVVNYIKRIAADENGKVRLDFVLGTHAHSDHLGGFDTVIDDPDITVSRAYLKVYNPEIIMSLERDAWDNQEVYDQMVDACERNGVELIQQIPAEPFALGNLTITLLNGAYKTDVKNLGENENSIATLVEKDGVKALLTGDMNNICGDETEVAAAVGEIDLLKLGHHGHIGSTTMGFAKALNPKIGIVTNYESKVSPTARASMRAVRCPIYGVGDKNGIIAQFEADGFTLYQGIHTA